MLGWGKKSLRLIKGKTSFKINSIYPFITKKVGKSIIVYLIAPRSRKFGPPSLEELGEEEHIRTENMEIEIKWEPDIDTIDALNDLGVDLDAFKYAASRLARLKIDWEALNREIYRAAYKLIQKYGDIEENQKQVLVSSLYQYLLDAVYDIREKHNIPMNLSSESLNPSPQPEDITKPAPAVQPQEPLYVRKPIMKINLSKLTIGPQCLSEFSADWHNCKWAVLFDLPRSALPTALIVLLLDKWKLINVETVSKREKIPTHSMLALTRTNYPSRYEDPIRPSPEHPYVERLLKHVEYADIVVTTKDIYNLNRVKERLDSLGFLAVEVVTDEEEKMAQGKLEKLNLNTHKWQVTPRLKKAATLLPWLADVYTIKGLEGVRKKLYETLEDIDAKMIYETIMTTLELKTNYAYKSLAISLGILGVGE